MKTDKTMILALTALLGLPACFEPTDDDLSEGDDAGQMDDGADDAADDGEPDPQDTGDDAGEGETGEGDTGDTDGGETDGGETDGGETDGGETDGGETGELDEAPEDGDSPFAPAVIAQFRNTAGAPVSVTGPLANQMAPLDVRGLEYRDAVSDPGDSQDFVQFNIVPGQNDPTIRVELLCDDETLNPMPLRAVLEHEDGQTIATVLCGEGVRNVFLQNASSNIDYRVRVEMAPGAEVNMNYALQINGFCFQSCNYQPFAG